MITAASLEAYSTKLPSTEPWGKDADMAQKKGPHIAKNSPTPLAKVGEVLIRFHQKVISPVDGPRSSYVPSSSTYTLEAIKKYGFLKGYVMGCDRLMRENHSRWVYPTTEVNGHTLKIDEVP